MNEHILTKLFLVTNMHLYINPKRGFQKILNFEQACHLCSKQAVQKQWSLPYHRKIYQFYMTATVKLKTQKTLIHARLIYKKSLHTRKQPADCSAASAALIYRNPNMLMTLD